LKYLATSLQFVLINLLVTKITYPFAKYRAEKTMSTKPFIQHIQKIVVLSYQLV